VPIVIGIIVSSPLFETPSDTPQSEKNIAISYSAVAKQSVKWMGSSGTFYYRQADTGKVFVEVKMTIKNNGYGSESRSFNTNPNFFNLVADKTTYSYDTATYSVDNWETLDVWNGRTYKGVLEFQVPQSATSFTLGVEDYLQPFNIVLTKTG
jgi:Domain of unknown function (DUF4352)